MAGDALLPGESGERVTVEHALERAGHAGQQTANGHSIMDP